jgi:hypothetical protein
MSEKKPAPAGKPAQDNRASQFNPNNDAYWTSRGQSRPAPNTGDKGKGS